ncbi:MAG: hypothetical protein Q4A28_06970 [Brachymonas sp.]|nr:hypothetical protein [Brachymonas sp.]
MKTLLMFFLKVGKGQWQSSCSVLNDGLGLPSLLFAVARFWPAQPSFARLGGFA